MDDYSKKIHVDTSEIAKEMLVKLAENKDTFVISDFSDDPAVILAQNTESEKLANEIISILATKNIPLNYTSFWVNKLIDNLTIMKQFIDGKVRSSEDEYLSRALGVKNTDGKYRKEESSLGHLLLKVNEIRETTGNNIWDYYNQDLPEGSENLQEK